jgi:hypothetical protein
MIIGKTSIAEISKEDDIFIIRFLEDTELSGEHIKELLTKLESLTDGKKYKTLANTVNLHIGPIDLSAYQENIKNENAPHRIAEAFVVSDLPIRLLINFYHKNSLIPFPSKVFKNVEDAMKWLKAI